MYKNIIFIGGIHGVGKGTICSKIQQELELKHLSASEVLRWSEVSPDASNKLVKDIPDTQDRLIKGLERSISPSEKYILDGHFCLFDWQGKVNHVPIETFMKISPILISVVICEPMIVSNRLQSRDDKNYDVATIKKMQNMEVEYAKSVAKNLNIDFSQVNDDPTDLILRIESL